MMISVMLLLLCTSYANTYLVSILIMPWSHFTFNLLWKFLPERVFLWLSCSLSNFIPSWTYCTLTRWLVSLVTLWLLSSIHRCCKPFFGSMPKVIVLMEGSLWVTAEIGKNAAGRCCSFWFLEYQCTHYLSMDWLQVLWFGSGSFIGRGGIGALEAVWCIL